MGVAAEYTGVGVVHWGWVGRGGAAQDCERQSDEALTATVECQVGRGTE